jgi:hypothetical protein
VLHALAPEFGVSSLCQIRLTLSCRGGGTWTRLERSEFETVLRSCPLASAYSHVMSSVCKDSKVGVLFASRGTLVKANFINIYKLWTS